MHFLTVQEIDTKGYPDRGLTPEYLNNLAEDIEANGLIRPIIISPTGALLQGNARMIALTMLGCEYIPCEVRNIPPDQYEAYRTVLGCDH